MKNIFALILSLSTYLTYGQDMLYFNTIDSKPLRAVSYAEISGSPYFMDKEIYRNGIAQFASGEVYKDIKLLYNQLTDEVTFKYADEAPKLFSKRPSSFVIFNYKVDGTKTELVFHSSISSSKDPQGLAYYQILTGGDIKLLKRTIKTVSERKGYGESTVKKTFESETKYFLQIGDKLEKISSYKDFIALNNDMKKIVNDYGLKKNSEENFIELTNHYNSLK